MSLDTFNAVVEGYSERLFDLELLQVHSGFWSGYYSNSKHPKGLKQIVTQMINAKNKKKNKQKHVDEVDVDAFLATEKAFKERLAKSQTEK